MFNSYTNVHAQTLKTPVYGVPDCQVLETAHQVGILPGSTGFDVPYMEMANQCEELTSSKQEKMFHLMNIQIEEQILPSTTTQFGYEADKLAPYSQSGMGY